MGELLKKASASSASGKSQQELENDHLRKLVATLEKRLEDFEKARWQFRKAVGRPPRAKNCHFRVAVGDSHGALIDESAATAFLEDLRWLQPKELILLGDHIDCGGFLAEHHVMGYVADNEYTYSDDVTACNWFLDRVQEASPRSVIDWTEGNHDVRPERWIMTQKLRSRQDVSHFYQLYGTPNVTHVEKRGINYWKISERYLKESNVAGTIKRGKCYFQHSKVCGAQGTYKLMRQFNACVVHGNSHAMVQFSERTVSAGEIGGWSAGCLCKMQPLWYHRDPDPWVHGYHLQLVEDDGPFLAINIPVIGGRSLLDVFQRLLTNERNYGTKTKAKDNPGGRGKNTRQRGGVGAANAKGVGSTTRRNARAAAAPRRRQH
jgi:hypothetical protein